MSKPETTNTAPKTETNHTASAAPSPAANPFAQFMGPFAAFTPPSMGAFDPIAMWTQTQQAFASLWTETYGRATSFSEQYATQEKEMITKAQGAVATWSQLAQDAIAYSGQLSAEARKLGFETAKKMSVGAH